QQFGEQELVTNPRSSRAGNPELKREGFDVGSFQNGKKVLLANCSSTSVCVENRNTEGSLSQSMLFTF
ncbi:hypothetical protein MYX78_00325, partial [Acidobacteria bacterium AH-259-G07]|nr:hypothetical protein [Acidobacteria bacterium AH-259-G07]